MSMNAKDTKILSKLSDSKARVARPLAPEDIRVGMRVMVLTNVYRFPRWASEYGAGIDVAVFNAVPCSGQRPLRVRAVCLPYVLVETSGGDPYCYDVRNVRLARVGASFDRAVRAIDLKKDRKKRVRKKSKGGGKESKRRSKAGKRKRRR